MGDQPDSEPRLAAEGASQMQFDCLYHPATCCTPACPTCASRTHNPMQGVTWHATQEAALQTSKMKTSSKQHGDVTDSLTAAVHHSKAQHASYQKFQTLVLLSFITLDTVNKRLIRRQHHCVLGKCRKHWSRYTFNLLSEQRLFTCMFRNMQHQHQPTCSTTLSLTQTWHMHSDPAYDYCRIRHAHQASSHASQYCWCPVVHIPGKLYCRNLLSGTSCPPA